MCYNLALVLVFVNDTFIFSLLYILVTVFVNGENTEIKYNIYTSSHLSLDIDFLKILKMADSLTSRCKLFHDLLTLYAKVLAIKLFLAL